MGLHAEDPVPPAVSAIVLFCCIGTYGISNSVFNVWLMLGCALVGYFFIKVGVEPAPLLLGLVLGPQLEENFRRAMAAFRTATRACSSPGPISALLLGIVVLLLAALLSPPCAAQAQAGARRIAFSLKRTSPVDLPVNASSAPSMPAASRSASGTASPPPTPQPRSSRARVSTGCCWMPSMRQRRRSILGQLQATMRDPTHPIVRVPQMIPWC